MQERTKSLEALGLTGTQQHWNPVPAATVELALARGEGALSDGGTFVAVTTPFTGRSPDDKWLVREPGSAGQVWWGKVNRAFEPEQFDRLLADVKAYLNLRELFVRDLYASADPAHRLRVRLVSERAWPTLFAHNLFIRPPAEDLPAFAPNFTILHAPEYHPDPARHGVRRPAQGDTAAIVLDLASRTIVIAGTRYAGEIKKSIFSALNYLLPTAGVLPMHCSANIGPDGGTALYFGLSGTGKTTLSANPARGLIGDDEHGWGDGGVFNFEGGCYAKIIRLSAEAEPEIYGTLRRFGTVLENVVMDPGTRALNLASDAITENTRAAYPIDFIPNFVPTGRGGHPNHIIFLTADAFGVLPPLARLTPEQAMYHFLSGYTAKLAGTERGVSTPQATFSACFAGPFLVHPPSVYGEMLRDKINRHQSSVWLVNTGWSGGPPGVGQRMKLAYTRAMVNAVLSGALRDVPTQPDPVFRVLVPATCPGVPPEVLQPRNTWADKAAYDVKARELARAFADNFAQYAPSVDPQVAAAGPLAN
ncbi:MAG: phosphoenolpyruvate carboxykinase (ATP) [Anaerolineales bacterium]|nr:phosphoenolpyruvate carboxykinase (ATP) [Anaerolineales bacterium]